MMANRALPKSFWWSVGSLVPMVVGAFGPWAKVTDLVTINGTDGGRDGWFVLGAAVTAAVALLAFARFRRGWLFALPLLAGLLSVAATAYDLNDLGNAASDAQLFGLAVSAGWGIYVALGGSISLVVASIALVIENRYRKPTPEPLEAPSAA